MSSEIAAESSGRTEDAIDGPRIVALDDGREIAYTSYGDPTGDPVVFLHGTPGSRRLGELLESAGAARGLRILALDRPGYGESSAWSEYTHEDAPRVVTAVMDDAGVSAAGLVAFSGGAIHALATAASDPDRITRVDVVSGVTPPSVSDDRPRVQRALAVLATRTPRLLGALFRGQAWAAHRGSAAIVAAQYTEATPSEALRAETIDVVADDFVEAVTGPGRATTRELTETASRWEVDYDAITADIHLWHGERDTNVPLASAEAHAEAIDGAEINVLNEADHLTSLLEATPALLDAHA
jgi:pimeloyl-ACP methyl ester carboxylesterase